MSCVLPSPLQLTGELSAPHHLQCEMLLVSAVRFPTYIPSSVHLVEAVGAQCSVCGDRLLERGRQRINYTILTQGVNATIFRPLIYSICNCYQYFSFII